MKHELRNRSLETEQGSKRLIKVILLGAALLSAGAGEVGQRTVVMRVTAYCPCEKCCGRWSDGVTASGHEIRDGDRFVAADKSVPFGTLVCVPGYAGVRPVEVLDRGGAIDANELDVFFDSHAEALEWGVQVVKVRFVE